MPTTNLMGRVITGATGIRMPVVYGGGGVTSYVSDVSYYTITIGSGATSNTQTISSVDTSKTFIVYLGNTAAASIGYTARWRGRVELTDATTLTAYRNTSDTGNLVLTVAVVQCTSSLVSSIQHGTASISSSTSGTSTISSVDTSRSAVFYLGYTGASTSSGSAFVTNNVGLELTNSTTVTAYANNSGSYVGGYVVVEFQSAAIASSQQFRTTYSDLSTTNTQTISSVTTSNAAIIYGGYYTAATTFARAAYEHAISSSTNVNLIRNNSNSADRTPCYGVLEFASGVLNSKQTGGVSLAGLTSNTATVSSVTTSKSLLIPRGFSLTGSIVTPSNVMMNLTLTNSTTVTATKTTTSSSGQTANFTLLEFN